MESLYREVFSNKGRKILAVAKNYFEHAIEMQASGVPPHPVIFQKPLTSVINQGQKVIIPPGTEVHHEIELGVMLCKGGKNIPEDQTDSCIGGYFVALDLTARNLQAEAKTNSWPWDVSKGFDTFLPLSELVPKEQVSDPYNLELELLINGQTKQKGSTGDMHFKAHYLISYLSTVFTLCEGDLILTGTPAGVGPIHSGDLLTCLLRENNSELVQANFNVE